MYDRILMAVDHSDVAERVINAARELASLSNGEVWVLHLREMETMSRAGFVPIESGAEAQSIVEHAAKELHDAGVKAHYEVNIHPMPLYAGVADFAWRLGMLVLLLSRTRRS
jgi:nucleotide-binding universal stress UspA family protein